MSTSDSVHNIYVAKSYVDSLAGIESPRLSFYVNGEKRYETSESVQEFSHSDKRFSKQKMTVKTRIEANDEIKIVLEAEGLSAEAEIIVPKTPKISKVEKYKLKEDSGEGYFWKFLPEVEDIKGEKNWYRFEMVKESEDIVIEEKMPVEDNDTHVGYHLNREIKMIEIDNTSEPFLNKGINIGIIGGNGNQNYFSNSYNIFTDTGFENSSRTFTLKTRDKKVYEVILAYTSGFKFRHKVDMIIRLGSMSRLTYTYLDAIMFNGSNIYAIPMVIGARLPSNVSGGVGFVGAISQYDYVLHMPDSTVSF